MNLGAAQIDITPLPGVELSGFAARVQPSVGVLDPLFAKALYLSAGEARLLWIHCDLVGLDRSIVLSLRRWAGEQLGLRRDQVMLSATHTHSGACTIDLQECGKYDDAYVEFLQGRLRQVAKEAVAVAEPVELAAAEGDLRLAVDRRKTVTSHTDPRVAAVGFRRSDGSFVAIVVNYAMHAVALGASNRLISADVPGQVARALSEELPGAPIVLVTNGACGNLNPPAENVPFAQVKAWGEQIAKAVAPRLLKAPAAAAGLRTRAHIIPLPVDVLDAEGINAFAERALQDRKSLAAWNDKYRRVVEHWRSSLLTTVKAGARNGCREAELFAIGVGDVIFLGASAEVFSEFTDWLRRDNRGQIYLVGYANGDLGYLPTRAAYAEGGYEVEVAHLFYGGFRPKAGGLELLAEEAAKLLRDF